MTEPAAARTRVSRPRVATPAKTPAAAKSPATAKNPAAAKSPVAAKAPAKTPATPKARAAKTAVAPKARTAKTKAAPKTVPPKTAPAAREPRANGTLTGRLNGRVTDAVSGAVNGSAYGHAARYQPPPLTPTSGNGTASPPVSPPPHPPALPAAPPSAPPAEPDVWDERVAGMLGFLRRRITGQYDVDEFGFDPDLTQALVHPLLRLAYRHYFRVDVTGTEHLPRDSSALIVANHSGTVPIDALMLSMAVHDETPKHRHLRLLGADLVFRLPVLSELARKAGSTLACNPDAERLLRNGEYVGVFPEGFKGIGKPYRDRYKLQRFGRGGFVAAALRTGTPIVPVAIVGAEEIYPIVANVKPLAKVTGLPYVPVTPTFPWLGPLGMLPLPSKWLIHFGEPIETALLTEDADDPIVVFNLADQVRETIQQSLHELLERRPDPFT